MPITNLAIQRKRWNELHEIFNQNESIKEIVPYYTESHRLFKITSKKFSQYDLNTLKFEFGWELINIKQNPEQEGYIDIIITKDEIEKLPKEIQEYRNKTGIQNIYDLRMNFKINYLESQNQLLKEIVESHKKMNEYYERLLEIQKQLAAEGVKLPE